MLTVQARATGRRRLAPDWDVPLGDDWHRGGGATLRDLITWLVRAQVAAFDRRQADARLLRVLSERELDDGARGGRIAPGGRALRQHVDVDIAIAVALQAFEDGLYLTLIDGLQYHRLDEPVMIAPDSTVTFIRLVALAGG